MQTAVYNTRALLAEIHRGRQPKYLFFWGHQPKTPDQIDKACLSQWYPAGFEDQGIGYPTAEHYMMAEKARLFQDEAMLETILKAPHPGAAKKFGRQVAGFDDRRWEKHRFDIVVKGSILKFSQNNTLRTYLLTTKDRVLVEASPRDKVWGIGLAANDPRAGDPAQWRGLNLLGFALM